MNENPTKQDELESDVSEVSDLSNDLELDFRGNYKSENTDPLARLWPHLVGPWTARWAAEDVLKRDIISEQIKILGGLPRMYDFAVGIGIGIAGLANLQIRDDNKMKTLLEKNNDEKGGGDLSFLRGNELDPNFQRMARFKLGKVLGEDVVKAITLDNYKWQNINTLLDPGSVQYGIIEGNATVCCGKKDEQIATLEAIYPTIEPVIGRLSIDIRHWENVKRGPIATALRDTGKTSGAIIDGKPMYNGKKVISNPIAMDEEAIKFRYCYAPEDKSEKPYSADLVMATPTVEEFVSRIQSVGFKIEQILSDFKPGLRDKDAGGRSTRFVHIVTSTTR